MGHMGGLAQLVAVLGTIGSLGSSQALGVDEIVRQNFPALRLSPEGRDACFQVRNVDSMGRPTTIVAGYTDLDHAVIRILNRHANE